MMRDAAEATRVLEGLLRRWEAETGVACVPVGSPVEHGPYWVQGYQSRAFAEHGDENAMLAGNGPVVIPKDGSDPFVLSSAEPADVQMARLLSKRGEEGAASGVMGR